MATITPNAMTYPEWGRRHDPDGKVSTVIDLLAKANPQLDDAVTTECQNGNVYQYTQVVRLPSPSRRGYYQGVPNTIGGVAKLTTTCSEYGDWSKIDRSLAMLNGQMGEIRAQEDAMHWEGMAQSVATDIWYSNRTTDPTAFTGMANIYNTVNPATSAIAGQVLDAGGTGSTNTSMWLISWGPRQIHLIMPKGIPAGIQMKDYGDLPVADVNGNEYPLFRTWLQWDVGLAIEDYRWAVRACNIDITLLNGGSAANLINLMAKMLHRTPLPVQNSAISAPPESRLAQLTAGRAAFYCNRTLATYLDLQAMNKTNVWLMQQQWNGMAVTTFRGIPIRVTDSLLDTESRVV